MVYTQLKKENQAFHYTILKYMVECARSSELRVISRELARPLLLFSNTGKDSPPNGGGFLQVTKTYRCVNDVSVVPLAIYMCTDTEGSFVWTVVRSNHTSHRFMEAHMLELKGVLTEYCQGDILS